MDDPQAAVRLHSVHSSALYAPWPFAVTAVEELAAPEVFEFDGPEGRRLRGGVLALWFDRARRGLALDAPDGVWAV